MEKIGITYKIIKMGKMWCVFEILWHLFIKNTYNIVKLDFEENGNDTF